jgi:hypothetical protein
VWKPGAKENFTRVLDGATHDLSVSAHAVAAATSRGLWVLARHTAPVRIDRQGDPSTGKFFAVAWHRDALFAGDMEGLYRYERECADRVQGVQVGSAEGFDANWVTALLSDGERLLVGTYDRGVFAVAAGRATRVRGLESQWVPPHALRRFDGELYVGGLGMRAVKVDRTKRVTALELPVRDTNDFFPFGADVVIATNDGVLRAAAEKTARR